MVEDVGVQKNVEQLIRERFAYRRSLAAEQLIEELKNGDLFGYVQGNIEIPKKNVSDF